MHPHGPSPWDTPEPNKPRVVLDDHERTRVSHAFADLDEARCADLTLLNDAGLIRLVERLRASLDDVVQLLSDLQT